MNFNIAVIKGDGIGPEVVGQALRALDCVGEKYGHTFNYTYLLMGGCAIDETGAPLPEETVSACMKADSVLLGAVGGPKWDGMKGGIRPEAGLLGLRSAMGLYANIRPAKLFPPLKNACPLRADIAEKGIDMVVVRELTGGIYFGERGRRTGKMGAEAYDTEAYSEAEIRRIAKIAFDTAMSRKKRLVSIDKANVLETSRMWRETVHETAKGYPGVSAADMLVDNAAMQLVKDPSQFDVVLASNMFGDILSDEAAMVTGSIGMLASASLGSTRRGLYEPIHGSAPDIAGQDKANPIATILSAAMMLKYSLRLDAESAAVESAVARALESGARTPDIMDGGASRAVGTEEMGALVCGAI